MGLDTVASDRSRVIARSARAPSIVELILRQSLAIVGAGLHMGLPLASTR
jgi:hypothetical protein